MSIFKNILFLDAYPDTLRTTDDAARSYATGYGNHVASARALAPLGHAHAINRTAVAGRATRPADEARALASCH